ncbi:ribosome biogenesis protein ytm1 [Coemansia sp. RSA 1933]|nr:ribosome biogenesis protein ytm1 [Coemansia sp. RSA 1933]
MMDAYVAKILEAEAHSLQSADALLDTELTLDVAQQLSAELDGRLRQSKEALKQRLLDSHATYMTASDEVGRAKESIAQLLHGVDELQAMFGDEETGIRARVIDAQMAEAQARKLVDDSGAVLRGLRVLASVNDELRAMDVLVRDARHSDAARAIRVVEKAVVDAHELDGTRIRIVLDDRIHMAAMNVKENVLRDLWRLVAFDVADSTAAIKVAPPDAERIQLAALHEALSTLDAGKELACAFSDRFVRDFVAPLLSVPCLERSTDKGGSGSDDVFAVILRRGGEPNSATPAAEVCTLLDEALSFISEKLAGAADDDASVRHMLWADGCADRIAAIMLDRCVLGCIPTTRKDLAGFRTRIDVLVAFEDRLFAALATDSDVSDKDDRPIRAKAGQIEDLFSRRRCDQALSRVRMLAESSSFSVAAMDCHEEWSVGLVQTLVSASSDSADLQAAPALIDAAAAEMAARDSAPMFPRCTVSAAIRGLVSTAYGLVNEAVQSSQGVMSLFADAARCVFDVYRALFLTLHRAQLTKVPALGWQFFNDCMYAAYHAGILGALAARALDSSADGGWTHTAHLYVAVGRSHVATIVRQETDELRRLATGGSGAFLAASSDAGTARLDKIANQARLSLTQLARAIRPPAVTPHVFYRTLGTYMDAVFGATVDTVTAIGDIGVDDSQALSNHCRAVHALVTLFQLDSSALASYTDVLPLCKSPHPDPVSSPVLVDNLLDSDDSVAGSPDPVHRSSQAAIQLANEYCTGANKLAQLADILVISRADIVARRRAGLLDDFSAEELVALVYALFAATVDREHDIMLLESL